MEGWVRLGDRPLVFPAIFFVVGVSWLSRVTGSAAAHAVFLGGIVAVAWLRNRRTGSLLALLGAFALLGSWSAALEATHHGVCYGQHTIAGRVDSVRHSDEFTTLVVSVSDCAGEPARFRALLTVSPPTMLYSGQEIVASVNLTKIEPASNPGEVDRRPAFLLSRTIVRGHTERNRLVALTPPSSWQLWMQSKRERLIQTIVAQGNNGDASALLLTLSVGERAALGDDMEDVFARSGLAHVLSVSGLHVAVFAFAVLWFVRAILTRRMTRLFRRVEARRVAAPLCLPFIWFYVAFTGFQEPAIRSAIMCSSILAGLASKRRNDPLNALMGSALIMLAVDPSSISHLSLQLSFTSVAALLIITPSIAPAFASPESVVHSVQPWQRRLNSLWRSVSATGVASIAVTLSTAPLLINAFGRVSLAGLLSNIVTLPISSLLTLLSAGGAGIHVAFEPAAKPVLWLALVVCRAFVAIAEFFAVLPGAAIEIPTLSAPSTWLWMLVLVCLVITTGAFRRASIALMAGLIVAIETWPTTDRKHQVEVTFLAVGQGDATLVSSQGHHALIDGGGVPQGRDPGRSVILPFLKHKRISHLDLVALTHAHPDHSLGLVSVLEEIPAHRLWIPEGIERGSLVDDVIDAADGAIIEEHQAGDNPLQLGEAEIQILGPPADRILLESENDRSLVLLIRHRNVTFLMTGDIEEAGELALDVGEISVLKAPHHGSTTSSTPRFVKSTSPRHVIFCVGRNNRFGFPKADVVSRYEAIGARCYRTDRDGAITFRSNGEMVEVRTFLQR